MFNTTIFDKMSLNVIKLSKQLSIENIMNNVPIRDRYSIQNQNLIFNQLIYLQILKKYLKLIENKL